MLALMPEWQVLVPFVLATVVLAVTPGPDMALYVGRAISHGRHVGLACFAGAVTGILIHTMMVALGLSALLVAAPTAFLVLKIVGALYLLWLAIQTLREGSSFNPRTGQQTEARHLWQHYATGVAINLLNPKIVLFFLTFLPQFVSPEDPLAPYRLFVLGILFLVVAIPVVLPMIFAADRFARFLKTRPIVTRALDWLLAGVFGMFALTILRASAR